MIATRFKLLYLMLFACILVVGFQPGALALANITGCTELAATIECHDGTFSGNYIDTWKNISIHNAVINTVPTTSPICSGTVEGLDGYIRFNSTQGWIKIIDSTINSNALASDRKCGSLETYNAPQGLYIINSVINARGLDDGCGPAEGSCAWGGDSVCRLRGEAVELDGATFNCFGGSGGGGEPNAFGRGGYADFDIIGSSSITFVNNPTTINTYGGSASGGGGPGGVGTGGSGSCTFRGSEIITNGTHFNATCDGGDGSGGTTRIGGGSGITFYADFINITATIDAIGGSSNVASSEGNVNFIINNFSALGTRALFNSGKLTSSSGAQETAFITVKELTLHDYVLDIGNDPIIGTGIILVEDVARIGQFGSSSISEPQLVNYDGDFGTIVIGQTTSGLNLGGVSYEVRGEEIYYAPLSRLTSPANNTVIPLTQTFVNDAVSDANMTNATLYNRNTTGLLTSG